MGSQAVWERLQTKYEGRTTDLQKREFDLRSRIEAMESLLNGDKDRNCQKLPTSLPKPLPPDPGTPPTTYNPSPQQGIFNPQSQMFTGAEPMEFFANQHPGNYPISHMNFFPRPSDVNHGLNEANASCRCPNHSRESHEESESSGGFLNCIKSMLGRSKQPQPSTKEQTLEESGENIMLGVVDPENRQEGPKNFLQQNGNSTKRKDTSTINFECKCQPCEFKSNGRRSNGSSPRGSFKEAMEECSCKSSAIVTNGPGKKQSFLNPQCICQPCEFMSGERENLNDCTCENSATVTNESSNISKDPPRGKSLECRCDSCSIMPKSQESSPRRGSVKQCSCAEGSAIDASDRKTSKNSSSPGGSTGVEDLTCGCNGSAGKTFEDYPPCGCDDAETVSKISTAECVCSQGSQLQSSEEECDCKNEKSLVSLTSADMFYLQNLQNLATQQKILTNQIKDLEAKEKIYQQVLQEYKGLDFKSETSCKCNQATQSSDSNRQMAELKLENLLLKNELKEMRTEVRQYLEKMEGPMQFKIESEKYKCLKLEEQLDQLSDKLGETHEFYQKQMNDLKMQLMTATANNFSVNQQNEQMKKAMDDCMIRCNGLEDDLLRQKLSDGRTIKRLNDLLEQAQKLAAKQKESCNLYDIARDLSQTIKESVPCKDCSRLPSDLTGTVQCVKDLADIVHAKLPPKKPTASGEPADNELSTKSSEFVMQKKIEIQTVPSGKISRDVLVGIKEIVSRKFSNAGSEQEVPESGSERTTKISESSGSSRGLSKISELPEATARKEESTRKLSKSEDMPNERKFSKTQEMEIGRSSKIAEDICKSSRNGEICSEKSEENVGFSRASKSESAKKSCGKLPRKPPCACSTPKQKELVAKSDEVNQIWPSTSERLKVCHQVTASQDLLKSQTSIKCLNVPENFPFDVETKVDVLEKVPDGVHVTTTITRSGMLEVITEGPEGVIETTLVYTESGNVEVVTEIIEFSKTGTTSNLGQLKALPPAAKSCELPSVQGKSCSQPKPTAPQQSKCIESALKRKARIADSPREEIPPISGSDVKSVESGTVLMCKCQECPGGTSKKDIESTKSMEEGSCESASGNKSQHSGGTGATVSRKSSQSDRGSDKEENAHVERSASKVSSKKSENIVEKSMSMSAHVENTNGNVTIAVSSLMSETSSEQKLDVEPIASSPSVNSDEQSD